MTTKIGTQADVITVRERLVDVTEARPDAAGIWTSQPTGQVTPVWDVYLNDTCHATSPTRGGAVALAEQRAFIAGLLAGDPAAVGACALWCHREEQ